MWGQGATSLCEIGVRERDGDDGAIGDRVYKNFDHSYYFILYQSPVTYF